MRDTSCEEFVKLTCCRHCENRDVNQLATDLVVWSPTTSSGVQVLVPDTRGALGDVGDAAEDARDRKFLRI